MAKTKTVKLFSLLAIDIIFFLVELVVGLSVNSLALIADAFHMFNDILSLIVGIWAVRVANRKDESKIYTYGWQRAETLGALVNGVFLVALCMSIFLEAIKKFFKGGLVSNPRLILIVGCCGLASNILGLLLLHDHDHGHSHSHGHSHGHSHPAEVENGKDDTTDNSQMPHQPLCDVARRNTYKTKLSGARRASTLDHISMYPNSLRADVIAAARSQPLPEDEAVCQDDGARENTPLLSNTSTAVMSTESLVPPISHDDHIHTQNAERQTHKAHSDLNMHGVLLHVIGDAVGNIGVIASALFIWLTDYHWRFYADPTASLVIAMIILHSAIPLCKASARILLQAVPDGIDVEEIKADLTDLPGITSCHALHIWQLSDTKLIATVHIEVDRNIMKDGPERYIKLASNIEFCLAAYGIHSSTIQPEFVPR